MEAARSGLGRDQGIASPPWGEFRGGDTPKGISGLDLFLFRVCLGNGLGSGRWILLVMIGEEGGGQSRYLGPSMHEDCDGGLQPSDN